PRHRGNGRHRPTASGLLGADGPISRPSTTGAGGFAGKLVGGSAGQVDGLVFEEGAEPLGSELAAYAGFLVAAEGGAELDPVAVEGQAAGAHSAGDAQRPLRVAAPHASRQAVFGVVGDADGVVVIVE